MEPTQSKDIKIVEKSETCVQEIPPAQERVVNSTKQEDPESVSKMTPPKTEKSKEEIMVEREAKKAAKQAAKQKATAAKPAEEKKDQNAEKKTEKSKEEIMAEREAKKAAKAAKKSGGDNQKPNQEKPQKSKEEIAAENKANLAAKAEKKTENVSNEKAKVEETSAEGGKSKAQLKAERRAKQEAQRAAKQAALEAKAAGGGEDKKGQPANSAQNPKAQKSQRVPDDIQADRPSVVKKHQKKLANANLPARTEAQRKVMLFSHLHQYERELSISRDLPVLGGPIPAAVMQLGLKYAEGTISGSNARCVAFLHVMKQVIRDYVTPEDKEMSRDLDATIKPYITFLKQCRTLSVSMGNAIR